MGQHRPAVLGLGQVDDLDALVDRRRRSRPAREKASAGESAPRREGLGLEHQAAPRSGPRPRRPSISARPDASALMAPGRRTGRRSKVGVVHQRVVQSSRPPQSSPSKAPSSTRSESWPALGVGDPGDHPGRVEVVGTVGVFGVFADLPERSELVLVGPVDLPDLHLVSVGTAGARPQANSPTVTRRAAGQPGGTVPGSEAQGRSAYDGGEPVGDLAGRSAVCASTITRTSGSVPEGRSSTRPVSPSSASASATAAATQGVLVGAGLVDVGDVDQHLRQPGHHRRPARPGTCPVSAIRARTCSAVRMPSPVVACRLMMTWPDCSPPRV